MPNIYPGTVPTSNHYLISDDTEPPVINDYLLGGRKLYGFWTQASEISLDKDQDGDGVEDTYICLLENTTAGGNETGRGVVTGADLVLTEGGAVAVPGAVGSPPSRLFNNTDESNFTATSTLLETLLTGNEFTIIVKIENLGNSITNDDAIFYLKDSDNKLWWFIRQNPTDNIRVLINGASDATEQDLGAAATNIVLYLAMWRGSGNTRAGWCTTGSGLTGQPTKWSDFAAGNRTEHASGVSPASGAFGTRYLLGNGTNNGSIDAKVYWVILSKTCLIKDNL